MQLAAQAVGEGGRHPVPAGRRNRPVCPRSAYLTVIPIQGRSPMFRILRRMGAWATGTMVSLTSRAGGLGWSRPKRRVRP